MAYAVTARTPPLAPPRKQGGAKRCQLPIRYLFPLLSGGLRGVVLSPPACGGLRGDGILCMLTPLKTWVEWRYYKLKCGTPNSILLINSPVTTMLGDT